MVNSALSSEDPAYASARNSLGEHVLIKGVQGFILADCNCFTAGGVLFLHFHLLVADVKLLLPSVRVFALPTYLW